MRPSIFLRAPGAPLLCCLLAATACSNTPIVDTTGREWQRSKTLTDTVRPQLEPDAQPWRGTQADAQNRAQRQQAMPVLRQSSRSWVGATLVPVNAEDRLPSLFSERYALRFADPVRQVDLATVAARLSQLVGVPVRIQPDVYSAPDARVVDRRNRDTERDNNQDTDTNNERNKAREGPRESTRDSQRDGLRDPNRPAGGVSGAQPLSVQAIDMTWNGSLKDFLDHLTDRLGLSWAYRDGAIVIMRFTTEVYELAAYPSGYEYAMGSGTTGQMGTGAGTSSGSAGGGGGATGGQRGFRNTTQLTVAEQGKVEGVAGILSVVKQLIASVPESQAWLTDGSGRLVVRTSRDMQAQVREFVRAENTNMLKQVHIQLDLYSVTLAHDNEAGIDWNVFYTRLMRNSGIAITSPGSLVGNAAGSVTFRAADGALTQRDPALFGTPQGSDPQFALRSSVIISALNEMGRNVQHRPVSIIALNRQWARKARLSSTGYLSETIPAPAGALGGVASLPGLRTDTVTTGDQFAVMPHVLDNNTVMLKFGISLSDLTGLFDVTSGAGVNLQRVQTPNTSTLSDQFTVALRPGEVMAITGLSRELSAQQQRTLAESIPLLAGGSRTARQFQEHFVVFLRVVSV